MKTINAFCFFLALVLFSMASKGQTPTGRVVINEYMPWPAASCGTNSEFVELLNFGPGPVDIGCYVLTNGQNAITIPAHTILQPGQFFVLSGQNILSQGCGNIDSTIRVNLNWNTCNCTSAPIDTTTDGFMTDGGFGNVNLVLLDPSLKMVDAVTRSLPTNPSRDITTSSANNDCSSFYFNLDSLQFTYETLGMSTGIANSFARKVDGDCSWIKTPQQSAGATNNATGNTASVQYDFQLIQATDCGSSKGTIRIIAKAITMIGLFPMNYTLVRDSNNNNQFDINDEYAYGVSNTPPEINVTGLIPGRYRITVSSVNGCNLKSFDFVILPCLFVGALPVQIEYFRFGRYADPMQSFEWQLTDAGQVKSITLEKSNDGVHFTNAYSLIENGTGKKAYQTDISTSSASYFRLKVETKDGAYFYSNVISKKKAASNIIQNIYPNPAKDVAFLSINTPLPMAINYEIIDAIGSVLKQGKMNVSAGYTSIPLPTNGLSIGRYVVLISSTSLSEVQSKQFSIIK